MNGSYFSLFDMAIAGIPALAFCAWQLVSINREIAKDKKKRTDSVETPSPDRAGHAIGEHRLDDR